MSWRDKAAMIKDDREDKLPKWVQDRLRHLRAMVETYREAAAEASPITKNTLIVTDRYSEFPKPVTIGHREHVTFFVREKYREDCARGFDVYPLNRRRRTEPVRFEGFGVVSRIDEVRAALTNCDLLLDASASVAVGRHLASSEVTDARRISFFFNPAGTDAVLITEPER